MPRVVAFCEGIAFCHRRKFGQFWQPQLPYQKLQEISGPGRQPLDLRPPHRKIVIILTLQRHTHSVITMCNEHKLVCALLVVALEVGRGGYNTIIIMWHDAELCEMWLMPAVTCHCSCDAKQHETSRSWSWMHSSTTDSWRPVNTDWQWPVDSWRTKISHIVASIQCRRSHWSTDSWRPVNTDWQWAVDSWRTEISHIVAGIQCRRSHWSA